MPVTIAYSFGTHAGHFTRRKQDQHALIIQLGLHGCDLLAVGAVAQVINRYKQIT
ncbi:hypothetical protein D3C75_1010900 [compost metagenome]